MRLDGRMSARGAEKIATLGLGARYVSVPRLPSTSTHCCGLRVASAVPLPPTRASRNVPAPVLVAKMPGPSRVVG